MVDLKPTAARLGLTRAIADGKVWTVAGSGRAWLRHPNAPYGRDREVSARVDELRDAGLTEVAPGDADMDIQNIALTEAGRAWLAEHDKES